MKFNIEHNNRHSQGIYIITNNKNGKFYIGSTKDFKFRYNTHHHLLKSGKHYNTILQRSCIKYGIKNFEFSLLELVDKNEDLFPRELFWINTLFPVYNIMLVPGQYTNRAPKKIRVKGVLHENDVMGIILMLNDGFSAERTAIEYNTTVKKVLSIKTKQSYKHLSYLLDLPKVSKDNISENIINKILLRLVLRHSPKRIAKAYSIPVRIVREIRKDFVIGKLKLREDLYLSYTQEDNCFLKF